MIFYLFLIVAVTALGLTILYLCRRLVVEAVEKQAAVERLTLVRDSIRSTLIPLVWALDEADPDRGDLNRDARGLQVRLRYYLHQAIVEVQTALGEDDMKMSETIVQVRDVLPPRRLPRYPQVPPYLATPEDVAHVDQGVRRVMDAIPGPGNVEVPEQVVEEARRQVDDWALQELADQDLEADRRDQ